jgi:lipoyl(octanoyl) transferase
MSSSNWSDTWTQRTSDSLEVYLLGMVDFESMLAIQDQFREDVMRRRGGRSGLFLCEHPPIVSIGREGSQSHLRRDVTDLARQHIDVRWLNRGGGAWMQCPGQLAAYLVLPLQRLGLGLREYRLRLEQAVLDVCRELHVSAHRLEGEPGVFSKLGQLANVGIAVRSGVSYFGLTLNVRPDLALVRMTRPNMLGLKPTSLEATRQRLIPVPKVRESLIRHLAERLKYDDVHLFTGVPGLVRTVRQTAIGSGNQAEET